MLTREPRLRDQSSETGVGGAQQRQLFRGSPGSLTEGEVVACGILLEAHPTPSLRDGDFSSFVFWDVKSSFGALVRIPCPNPGLVWGQVGREAERTLGLWSRRG